MSLDPDDSGDVLLRSAPPTTSARNGGSVTLTVGTAPVPREAPPLPGISAVHFYVRTWAGTAPAPFGPDEVPEDAVEVLRVDREGSVGVRGEFVACDPAAFRRLLDFFWACGRREKLSAVRGAINLVPGAGYAGGDHGVIHLVSPQGERLVIAADGFSVGGRPVEGIAVWRALEAWIEDMDSAGSPAAPGTRARGSSP